MNPPHDDVLILGGGAIGLATALALLESGRGVRILEAATVGGATSHGNCGTITPSHAPPLAAPGVPLRALRWMFTPDAPLYLKPRVDPALWHWLARFTARCNPRDWLASARGRAALLDDSRARLVEWIGRYGLDCEFGETGLDYVFRDPRNFEHYVAECAPLNAMGIRTEVIDGADYLRQEPSLHDGIVGAVRFPDDAHLRPDRYVAELARAVRERGGLVEEQCEVFAVDGDGPRMRVATAKGDREAGDVLLAAGAWSPLLARSLRLPWLRKAMQPGKGYSITWSRPSLVPRRPLTLHERKVCVTVWEDGFRLGSTMEFSGHDTTLNRRRLEALERGAREYLREPVGAVKREEWYGWRPLTWDDLPIIGRAPGHEHLWLATGHGMLGVSMSSATGRLVSELMTGAAPHIDPAPYAPSRFA